MKKFVALISIATVFAFIIMLVTFDWQSSNHPAHHLNLSRNNKVELIPIAPYKDNERESVQIPLKAARGFSVTMLAGNLPGARVMVLDNAGSLWVSQTQEGKVALIGMKNRKVTEVQTAFQDLNHPHGLAFDPDDPRILYIAEEDKISKVSVSPLGKPEKIIDLPGGGEHSTKTINFGPDKRLYVSIGSTCNACLEKDNERAKIFSLNKDGSDLHEYASGLRNTVFFTWSPTDGRMWGDDMGRDYLGDNLPPDEINVLEKNKFYGWPYCYGKKIQDLKFDPSEQAKKNCADSQASFIDLPAHSAPLGLDFVPEDRPKGSSQNNSWPQEYWYNLLVAYHGSWNKTEPTGYKIVRIKLDKYGNYAGTEDFIVGWLTEDKRVMGRPVDILIRPGGIIYISDDKAGAIYQVRYAAALNS